MRAVILCVALALPFHAMAAESDAAGKKEVEHLVSHLASSGCKFNRNGSWYDAARAVKHLNQKYEYLLKRNLVPTAEAFIERAASESSASGKPYLVRCPGQADVRSVEWFSAELAKFRAESGSAAR